VHGKGILKKQPTWTAKPQLTRNTQRVILYLQDDGRWSTRSVLVLKRKIGVSYNTTWNMKHKIMQLMKECDDSTSLTGISRWAKQHLSAR